MVTEDTAKLAAGITLASAANVSATVESNKTGSAAFTNDIKTGSLKITKRVTINNNGTNRTTADGTYRFTVKGANGFSKEVSIKVTNGRSNSVTVDGLVPGTYTVTEVTSSMPAGMTLVGSNDVKVEVKSAAEASTTFTNNRTVTPPPSESRTTTPANTTPAPSETPEPTPTPTPTPSPTPAVNISGQKVWRDESNAHNSRPNAIKIQLLRDGQQIREITINGKGDRWSYSFGTLPKVDETGAEYSYSVSESPVEDYNTSISGTVITNELIPRSPQTYTNFTGNKIWKDEDNADGARPNYITVRLMRNGHEVEHRTVTAANGWQFTFQNVPVDDGYGNEYRYEIREDSVEGYVGRIEDFVVTNSKLPEPEELTEFGRYGTPLFGMGEPELEELLDLFDYGTPLWGRPLKTGDEMPLYPIVFGGIGLTALVALIILMVINKKRQRNAA